MTLKISKIQIKNLCKSFDNKVVLDGISLDVYTGESLVIIGASGTGKSVLIKTILGLIQQDSGSIVIDGDEVAELSSGARQKYMRKFGMLFQGGALFDSLPVWENIAFMALQGMGAQGRSLNKKEAMTLAAEKLKAVNLERETLYRYPSELSGGMQKRVALARAIASNPEIIFFDEPTTGLDPITSSTINHLIRENVQKRGITSVTITHDMSSVRAIADRVALLHNGKIMWQGDVGELDEADNAYLHQFVHGLREGPIKSVY